MKKCPDCKMIVDADNECPFCYATLTYQPTCNSDKEKYVFNKYFIWYLIKKSWFSILCLIAMVSRLIYIRDEVDYFIIYPILCICISMIYSLFGRKIAKFIQWKYSQEYSETRVILIKVAFGIVAVIFSFVMG